MSPSAPSRPPAAPPLPPAGAGPGVLVALCAVQVLFGTHYVAAKLVLEEVPPRTWAAIRVAGAAAILWGLARLRGQRLPRGRRNLLAFSGFAMLGVVINQVCFVEGLRRTTAGHSALINCTIPVLTLGLGALVGRERLEGRKLAGLALALTGVAVLLEVERFDPGAATVQGDLLTLVNAVSFSTFLVVSKPVLERTPSLAATALLFLLGAGPVMALGLPEASGIRPGATEPPVLGLMAYIIIFPTVLAYLLNYWALRRAPSSLVALFIYLQPVVASLLALAWLGEPVTPRGAAAFLLVASGIGVSVRTAGLRRTR